MGTSGLNSATAALADSSFEKPTSEAGNPKELVDVPISTLVDIQMRKRPQGKWNLTRIELVFCLLTEREPVDLCVIRSRWGLP